MPLSAKVLDQALDLPPPYRLVTLRESGDAFAHACAIAGSEGAGTIVWTRRFDLAEFAVVLEPEDWSRPRPELAQSSPFRGRLAPEGGRPTSDGQRRARCR